MTNSLPPNQQYKVKKLLSLIKDNPDIDWSDKGELIYKQSLIPKSHVADLFGDALAPTRPAEGAVGWEAFDEGIAHVPSTLVKKRITKRKRGRSKWIKN